MCENNIIAFGMNAAEIMLTIFAIGSIIGLTILMIAYLNGHFANGKE